MEKQQYVDYAIYLLLGSCVLSGAIFATKGNPLLMVLNTVMILLGVGLLVASRGVHKGDK